MSSGASSESGPCREAAAKVDNTTAATGNFVRMDREVIFWKVARLCWGLQLGRQSATIPRAARELRSYGPVKASRTVSSVSICFVITGLYCPDSLLASYESAPSHCLYNIQFKI